MFQTIQDVTSWTNIQLCFLVHFKGQNIFLYLTLQQLIVGLRNPAGVFTCTQLFLNQFPDLWWRVNVGRLQKWHQLCVVNLNTHSCLKSNNYYFINQCRGCSTPTQSAGLLVKFHIKCRCVYWTIHMKQARWLITKMTHHWVTHHWGDLSLVWLTTKVTHHWGDYLRGPHWKLCNRIPHCTACGGDLWSTRHFVWEIYTRPINHLLCSCWELLHAEIPLKPTITGCLYFIFVYLLSIFQIKNIQSSSSCQTVLAGKVSTSGSL